MCQESHSGGWFVTDTRLVIPSAMRTDVLVKLQEGHQGIIKFKAHARQSVWWPGLSQQINEMLNCSTCIQERHNRTEPLIRSECLDCPWQNLVSDLFEQGGLICLLLTVSDQSSRYVEITDIRCYHSSKICLSMPWYPRRHHDRQCTTVLCTTFCFLCILVWIKSYHKQPKVCVK